MNITIGMPAFKDAAGVNLTVSCLRHYHSRDLLKRISLLVVDNAPEFKPGPNNQAYAAGETAEYIHTLSSCTEFRGAKVIPMNHPVGTSPAKDRVAAEADGDLVIICDSHVEFLPGSLEAVIDYFEQRPDSIDLVQAAIKFDPPDRYATHFTDKWSGEMWGQWAEAFKCGCDPDGTIFGTEEVGGNIRYHYPDDPAIECKGCGKCGRELPPLPWANHEASLEVLGYVRAVNTTEAFPIAAMGGFIYAFRKEAWVGFNPYFSGFGGEEQYIQAKFRAAGARSLCLPQFKVWHRFLKVGGGTKYVNRVWDKARNNVIGFRELGIPLERARKHYCEEIEAGKQILPAEWDALVKNPIAAKPVTKEAKAEGGGCAAGDCGDAVASAGNTIAELFAWVKANPKDLDQHADVLAAVAKRAGGRVTEITKRRHSTFAFAFGGAKEIVSYQLDKDSRATDVIVSEGIPVRTISGHGLPPEGIEPTDVLFLDSKHTGTKATEQLAACGPFVKQYIVLHDTQTYGEKGEDGKPGLLSAIREFVRDNPEWTVVYHTQIQHGLTVLSRNKEDKEALPSAITMAWNYAGAIANAAAKGFPVAPQPVIQLRLDTCGLCPHRNNSQCSLCGCFLAESPIPTAQAKAVMANATCPLGYWAESEKVGGPIQPPAKPEWLSTQEVPKT